MTERERLIELLKEGSEKAAEHIREVTKKIIAEKGRCNGKTDIDRRSIYEIEADFLLAKGVIVPPCNIGNMVDVFFSHNAIVHLWCVDPAEEEYSTSLWRGMAWDIPQKYKEMKFEKFFGNVPEYLYEADAINILVDLTKEEAKAALKEELKDE